MTTRFITLTGFEEGVEVLVNPAHIRWMVRLDGGATAVCLGNGTSEEFRESVELILDKIGAVERDGDL